MPPVDHLKCAQSALSNAWQEPLLSEDFVALFAAYPWNTWLAQQISGVAYDMQPCSHNSKLSSAFIHISI